MAGARGKDDLAEESRTFLVFAFQRPSPGAEGKERVHGSSQDKGVVGADDRMSTQLSAPETQRLSVR